MKVVNFLYLQMELVITKSGKAKVEEDSTVRIIVEVESFDEAIKTSWD